MGAERPESEKLVVEQDEESQSSGPLPDTTNERSNSQGAGVNFRHGKKQPKKLGKAVFRCMKRLSVSPLFIFKRARDCYISSLGGCAQNMGSFQPGFGGGGMGGPPAFASATPVNFRARMRESQRFDENCLSPAFKKAFNEAVYTRSASYMGHEGAQGSFKNSLGDFESDLNPSMRRAYSEATAFSRFPRGSGIAYRGPSPGWTPNRIGAGIMFPIQETPEYIRPSLRKVSDNPLDVDDFAFSKRADGVADPRKVKDIFEAVKVHSHPQKADAEAKLNNSKEDLFESQKQVDIFENMPRHPTTPLVSSISM